eukprot:TRINITY_DN16410_c0_g1_i1.p1 TRINITY_DN16410_c0_g1~~TRINITY_DN16410_c0_g1_i1.p1  ORF type:complete len:866 (+),score=324.26 TRINITY_DN16410_c0_g1_i1:38-2599(+)
MPSHDPHENYLLLESTELLLRRVGGGEADVKEAGDLFQVQGGVDYASVSSLVQRTQPQGNSRRRLGNLLLRLKQCRSSLDMDAKARLLQVLYCLRGARLQPDPSATLDSLRATKRQDRLHKSLTDPVPNPAALPVASTRPGGARLPSNLNVMPMSHFIRHGVYTIQGVASEAIPESADVADAPHSACQVAAEQLRELGKMQAQVKADLAKKSDRSLLHQSLKGGIREQMQAFDGAMAELMADCESVEQPVSLPRLLLAADKTATDLGFIRWMQLASDATREKGGALAATLESFSHHAAAPPGLFKSLRDAAFKPLLHMVCQWVTDGALDDPHEEFFVARAREKDVPATSDAWWDQKYTLREAMLPPFVPHAMAEDILLAGKSINFLRKLCNNPFTMPPSVKKLVPSEGGVHPDNLAELVRQAKAAVDERVLEVVFDDHQLAEHLYVARALGLLSQGQFFEEVYLGRVGHMLRSDYTEVMRKKYSLTPALEEGIAKTQIGVGLSIDPCRHIEVRMLEEGESALGLDRFYLLYVCPQPIRTVLRLSLLESHYKPIFCFLWKIRKIQKDLVLGRAGFKQILHARCHKSMARSPPDWWMKLHRASETASHVAHAMLQFVNALCSYMLTDGVDVLWKEFETSAKAAKTFDDVIGAHRDTIVALYRHALLDGEYLELKQCVESVLGVVTQYLAKAQMLHRLGQDMLLRLQDAADVSRTGGQWLGPTSSSVLAIEETGLSVNQLRRAYVREVGHLLTTLDRGLDPAKVARDSATLSHAVLSPRRVAELKARHSTPKLSMGSLQRLRTALDFNKYFQQQHDMATDAATAQMYSQSLHTETHAPIPNPRTTHLPVDHPMDGA